MQNNQLKSICLAAILTLAGLRAVTTIHADDEGPFLSLDAGVSMNERSDIGLTYKYLATFPEGVNHVGTHSVSLSYVLHF